MHQQKHHDLVKACAVCGSREFTQLTEAPNFNYFQCHTCRVIFLSPQPRPEALKAQYTRPGLLQDGPASAWFHHNKYYLKKLYQERLNDILQYVTTGILLDVGCGMGDFCAVAREAGFSGSGTELSDEYAQHTKTTVGMTDIFIGRLQDLDFSNKQFDVISLWHVFEHLPDPCEILKTMKGMLHKGGVIAIEVPNVECWRKRPMYASDIKNYPKAELEHLFYFSEASLKLASEQAGLSLLQLKYVDSPQPAKNWVKHWLRQVKEPGKRLLYLGREQKGFSAMRLYLSH
ncbi:class I SAM-dependent methyltransferase [Nitrospira sp. M1]